MTILSFILILCAICVAGFGVTRISDLTARNIAFAVLILLTVIFFLVAAGIIGSAPLRV